jgi:ribosomal protein L6P/L9E
MRNFYFSISYPDDICVIKSTKNFFLLKGFVGCTFFYLPADVHYCINSSKKNIIFFCKDNHFLKSISTLFMHSLESVSRGYSAVLQIKGFGYRIKNYENSLPASNVNFLLGYSHQISLQTSNFVKLNLFNVKNTTFNLFSFNRENVIFTAVRLKRLRKFNDYKGKGITLANERFTLKKSKKELES